MNEKEQDILQAIAKAFPILTEAQKERLLGFGEGLAFRRQAASDKQERPTA